MTLWHTGESKCSAVERGWKVHVIYPCCAVRRRPRLPISFDTDPQLPSMWPLGKGCPHNEHLEYLLVILLLGRAFCLSDAGQTLYHRHSKKNASTCFSCLITNPDLQTLIFISGSVMTLVVPTKEVCTEMIVHAFDNS